jgi:ketosteroid isomerase-like protein
MMRRFLLLPVLTLACIGLLRSQSKTEQGIVKYPDPSSSEDAIAEVRTAHAKEVLDDFAQAKVLARFHHALLNNDKDALDAMIADQVVWVAERFGKGENLTKAQVLAHFGSKKEVRVDEHTRDHVRLYAFGNTVVMTGNSSSIMKYKGQVSNGPRLFAIVWAKLDGRWQVIVHSIMDYDGML